MLNVLVSSLSDDFDRFEDLARHAKNHCVKEAHDAMQAGHSSDDPAVFLQMLKQHPQAAHIMDQLRTMMNQSSRQVDAPQTQHPSKATSQSEAVEGLANAPKVKQYVEQFESLGTHTHVSRSPTTSKGGAACTPQQEVQNHLPLGASSVRRRTDASQVSVPPTPSPLPQRLSSGSNTAASSTSRHSIATASRKKAPPDIAGKAGSRQQRKAAHTAVPSDTRPPQKRVVGWESSLRRNSRGGVRPSPAMRTPASTRNIARRGQKTPATPAGRNDNKASLVETLAGTFRIQSALDTDLLTGLHASLGLDDHPSASSTSKRLFADEHDHSLDPRCSVKSATSSASACSSSKAQRSLLTSRWSSHSTGAKTSQHAGGRNTNTAASSNKTSCSSLSFGAGRLPSVMDPGPLTPHMQTNSRLGSVQQGSYLELLQSMYPNADEDLFVVRPHSYHTSSRSSSASQVHLPSPVHMPCRVSEPSSLQGITNSSNICVRRQGLNTPTRMCHTQSPVSSPSRHKSGYSSGRRFMQPMQSATYGHVFNLVSEQLNLRTTTSEPVRSDLSGMFVGAVVTPEGTRPATSRITLEDVVENLLYGEASSPNDVASFTPVHVIGQGMQPAGLAMAVHDHAGPDDDIESVTREVASAKLLYAAHPRAATTCANNGRGFHPAELTRVSSADTHKASTGWKTKHHPGYGPLANTNTSSAGLAPGVDFSHLFRNELYKHEEEQLLVQESTQQQQAELSCDNAQGAAVGTEYVTCWDNQLWQSSAHSNKEAKAVVHDVQHDTNNTSCTPAITLNTADDQENTNSQHSAFSGHHDDGSGRGAQHEALPGVASRGATSWSVLFEEAGWHDSPQETLMAGGEPVVMTRNSLWQCSQEEGEEEQGDGNTIRVMASSGGSSVAHLDMHLHQRQTQHSILASALQNSAIHSSNNIFTRVEIHDSEDLIPVENQRDVVSTGYQHPEDYFSDDERDDADISSADSSVDNSVQDLDWVLPGYSTTGLLFYSRAPSMHFDTDGLLIPSDKDSKYLPRSPEPIPWCML